MKDLVEKIWLYFAKKVFLRFEFHISKEELKSYQEKGMVMFALSHGGVLEWILLSTWCRLHKFGPIRAVNRKRILFFSRFRNFFRSVLRAKTYSQFYLDPSDKGVRLLFVTGKERKKLFSPTPSEQILSDISASLAGESKLDHLTIVPVFILWRKHLRGAGRNITEYLFGLSSSPNMLGKFWYLLRKRNDSMVKALAPIHLQPVESTEAVEGLEESESMKVGKMARRKILVEINQEMRVVLGPRYQSPQLVKEAILRNPEVQALIDELSETTKTDRKKLMSSSYLMLTEIVADYRYRVIEVCYVVLNWLFAKVFDGLEVDTTECQRVREIIKTKPVVFIPCHRSHLDYLVIPYVLFCHDIVTPHIAAGINLSFWPVGKFLRMGGAFFIRRSFRGDKLYSLILKKYVEWLMKNRFNLKFFIEGTRSRSGKMLPPAYGMLKMVMESYSNGACEDIALIPVSICYDEVPEQGAYSKELSGGQKVKESASELIKSRGIVRKRFGKVYVHLTEALSMSEIAKQAQEKNWDNTLTLQKTAFQICKSINDATPITAKSLISTLLLTHQSNSLSYDEIIRLSEQLAVLARFLGYSLSAENDEAFIRSVEQTMRRLIKSVVIQSTESIPKTFYCENKKRVLLSFYKNNAAHCYVTPAISILSFFYVLRNWGPSDSPSFFTETLKNTSLKLRNLLKFDFFFNPTQQFLKEVEKNGEFFFRLPNWQMQPPHALIDALEKQYPNASDMSALLRFLGDYLESYLSFAYFYNEEGGATWEKKALLNRVVKFGESRMLQGGIIFPESISVVNYTNALQLFENLKFCKSKKEKDKTYISRDAQFSKIHAFIGEIEGFLELMQEGPHSVIETFKALFKKVDSPVPHIPELTKQP